ncbi:hypothetical protein PRIPAC_79954, partial [Pristionchus pacificus]|uniref:G protein-coupled receptor n=1 Tax=Pristionchus pacificus TaxID=54126 RepID=A0A2A6CLY9_PRIPA
NCVRAQLMFANHQLFEDPLKNAFYIAYHHVAIGLSFRSCCEYLPSLYFAVLSLMSNGALCISPYNQSDGKWEFNLKYSLIPEVWDNVCYMAAHGFVTGKLAVAYYATAHSHSFVILVFHFLYRLLAIKGFVVDTVNGQAKYNLHGPNSSRNRGSLPLQLGVAQRLAGPGSFIVMYWLHDMDKFVVDYMLPILRNHSFTSQQDINAYSVAVYWYGTFDGPRWSPILGMSIIHVRAKAAVRRKKTSDLTAQFMRALTYQTILPLLTAYYISVVAPFFGPHFPYIADITPLLCGLHTILDGCMLIYTIKSYR